MLKTKTITLNDGGHDCSFTIRKLGAIALLDLVFEIGQSVADTKTVSAKSILQFVNNVMESKTVIDGAKESEQAMIVQQYQKNRFEFMFDIIKGLFLNLDKYKRESILSMIVPTITFHNGKQGDLIQFNVVPNDPSNIDFYIDDFNTLVTLLKEVIMFNFAGIFSNFFGSTPNTK